MLTITDCYTEVLPCLKEDLGNHDSLLFFDIETTGLSARSSQLYLIGCLHIQEENFFFRQWFAESSADESLLLDAFSSYLAELPSDCLLLHFNGNGFDIPYLRQKYESHSREFPLDSMESLDLYRMIRPYKKVLGLASLRQKAIEDYLGIVRTDPFDGGQLIAVYENYLKTRSREGLSALLAHNDEDVRNMPRLLAILSLNDYMEANYRLTGCRLHDTQNLSGQKRRELLVNLESPVSLPRPISVRTDTGLYLTASGTRISLAAPLAELCLKHYFPDAKNYFYLPEEDRAIHKSVGIYVDKDHRIRATKDNCYIKKEGCFLPCPPDMEIKDEEAVVFCQDRRDKDFYLEWSDTDAGLLMEDFWNRFVHALWKSRR